LTFDVFSVNEIEFSECENILPVRVSKIYANGGEFYHIHKSIAKSVRVLAGDSRDTGDKVKESYRINCSTLNKRKEF